MALNIAGSTVSKFVKAQKELETEISELGVFGNSEGLFAIKELEDSVFARNNIGPKTREYIKSLRNASIAEMTFSEKLKLSTIALKEQAAAFLASPLGKAMVVTAIIGGIVAAINYFNKAAERSREKLVELKEAYQELESELETTKSELETIADRIDELNGKEKLSFTEKEELGNLQAQNRELQKRINLLQLEQSIEQEKINSQFLDTFRKDMERTDETIGYTTPDMFALMQGMTSDAIHGTEKQLLDTVFYNYQNNLAELDTLRQQYTKDLEKGFENKSLKSQIDLLVESNEQDLEYLQTKITQLLSDAEGVNRIANPETDEDFAINSALDYIDDISDRLNILIGGEGAKAGALSRLIAGEFADVTKQLQELGEQGAVTSDDIKDAIRNGDITGFIEKLQALGVVSELLTNEELAFLADGFNTLSEAAGNAGNSTSNTVLSFRDSLEAIQGLSEGFSQLKTIWQDVQNGATFDWASLIGNETLSSAFGELGEVYDKFIKTVANAPGDLDVCQSAFNDLAAAYVKSSGVLSGLTEETRNAAVAMLESMGVANAAIIVDEKLAIQKERLRYSTGEFAEMEYHEAYALYEATEASETARVALAQLVLEKLQINRAEISTAQDVQQLINLANAAGASAAYIENLKKVLAQFQNNEAKVTGSAVTQGTTLKDKLGGLPKAVNKDDTTPNTDFIYEPIDYSEYTPTDFEFSIPSVDLDSGSGSGSGSESQEETWFEKEYKLHKHRIAMEQESVSDFLAWLDDAYKKAYEEGVLALDDYRQYEEEVFDGLKEIQDNAKAAIESLVDYKQDMLKQELEDEKDSLDKRLDNLKDFYDKQKDLLEKQRDLEKTENERSGLRRDVQDIEADLQTLARDDSAWAAKRRLELEEELSKAKASLDAFEKDQAFDMAMDALGSAYSAQEQQIQAEMDALDKKLNDPHALYNQALAAIQGNTLGLYAEMVAYNRKHGSGKEDDVSGIYEEAYKSLLLYQQIQGKPYEGVTLPNATGYVGYASGTSYAMPGVHPVHENGYEYIFESADGSKYRVFQGGEMVLNAQDTKFLYNFASNGGAAFRQLFEYIAKHAGTTGVGGIPNAVQVTMGDVIIQGNADSRTVSQIRREQRSSIDYMLKELARLGK